MKWFIWGSQGDCSFGTGCSCMCSKLYVKMSDLFGWLKLIWSKSKQYSADARWSMMYIWATVWTKLWEAVWEKDMGHLFWGNWCLLKRCVCVCTCMCVCACVCTLSTLWVLVTEFLHCGRMCVFPEKEMSRGEVGSSEWEWTSLTLFLSLCLSLCHL